MQNPIKTPDFSEHLFWDLDLDGFDFEKPDRFLAQRVIEYGHLND
jgi:hypothetical protein